METGETRRIIHAHKRFLVAIFGEGEGLPRIYPLSAGEEEVLITTVESVVLSLPDVLMRNFVISHYGLKNGNPKGANKVCVELEIGRGKGRQVEERAFQLLRHPSRSNLLRHFIIPTKKERMREMVLLRNLFRRKQTFQLVEETTPLKEEDDRTVVLKDSVKEIALQDRLKFEKAFQAVISRYPTLYIAGDLRSSLPNRVRRALKRRGIAGFSQLKEIFERGDLHSVNNIGRKSLLFIQQIIEEAEKQEFPQK